MKAYHYTLDKSGRRVLSGLTYEETREFELLNAQFPLVLPGIAEGALPDDLRWWELFQKYEASLAQPAT